MISRTENVRVTVIPPARRAAWIGRLQLGRCVVSVKAYAAAVTSCRGPLRQLHTGCGLPIQQPRRCPRHGELPSGEVGKGVTHVQSELLELTASELSSLEPEDDRTIHVERYFDPRQFDLLLLSGRSFHLLPAHAVAAADHAAVSAALRQANVWGYGRMVLSGRRHQLIVQAVEERLQLHVLHRPAVRRSCPASDGSGRTDPHRIAGLTTDIAAASQPIPWNNEPDDWEQRLVELVQSKLEQRLCPTGGPRESGRESRRRRSPTNAGRQEETG